MRSLRRHPPRKPDFRMSAPNEPTKAETLRGGQQIPVTLQDGASDSVFVRQLPVKEFEPWLGCLDDEPRAAELMCGKESGWGDRLTVESLEAVIATGERLNRDFFERWLGRRTARKEWLAPLLARNAAVVGSLPTGSPNSASTAA